MTSLKIKERDLAALQSSEELRRLKEAAGCAAWHELRLTQELNGEVRLWHLHKKRTVGTIIEPIIVVPAIEFVAVEAILAALTRDHRDG